jgi:RNA polymerase sigma-70 factor (ECF subfamily)
MEAVCSREAQPDATTGDPVRLQRIAMTGPASDNPIIDAEQVLLHRLRAGDRAAFAAWVQQHQRALFAVAWRYVKNDQDAQDVVQAAFIRAWQGLPTFRGDSSLRTWLYRIAVNLALNHKRDARGRPSGEIPEHAASPEQPVVARLAEAEMHDRLTAAVDELPKKQRLVVELRVQQDLSFREVAEIVESTEDSAKANFHHALKRLRALLSEK